MVVGDDVVFAVPPRAAVDVVLVGLDLPAGQVVLGLVDGAVVVDRVDNGPDGGDLGDRAGADAQGLYCVSVTR